MQNCCLGSFWFLEGEVNLHYCGAVYGFYLLFFVSALRGFEFDFCSCSSKWILWRAQPRLSGGYQDRVSWQVTPGLSYSVE